MVARGSAQPSTSGRSRTSDRSGGPSPGVAYLVVGLMLALLIPLAMTSTMGAAAAVVGAIILVVVAALGLERGGAAMVTLGMFFAPMTRVVVPGASFATASDVLLLLGFGLLIPTMLRQPLRMPWQFTLGSAALFTCMLISSLLMPDPVGSLDLSGRVLIATVFLPAMFAWWRPDGRGLVLLAGAYVVGDCVSLLYGLATGPYLTTGRYVGLSEQPTSFGYGCALGVCLLPFLRAKFKPENKWLVFLAAGPLLLAIWLSGSRTSIVVLGVVAILFPLVERSMKAAMGLSVVGVLVLTSVGRLLDSGGGSNALSRLMGNSGATASDIERRKGFKVAWERFLDSPIIGKGFDFQVFLAHNIYMQIAAGIGLLGLVAFLLVLWSFVMQLYRGAHPYHLLAWPAMAYIIAGPITPNLGSRYVGVLLALALVASKMAPDDPPKEDADDAPPRGLQQARRGRTLE